MATRSVLLFCFKGFLCTFNVFVRTKMTGVPLTVSDRGVDGVERDDLGDHLVGFPPWARPSCLDGCVVPCRKVPWCFYAHVLRVGIPVLRFGKDHGRM